MSSDLPDPVVRLAGSTDVEELARLRVAMDEEDGVVEPEGFGAHFREWFDTHQQRFRIAVAEFEGRLIGTMWSQGLERVPRPSGVHSGPIGYITFAFVEAPYRSRGIGGALLDFLRSAAVDDGFFSLIVWPSEASVAFYRRAGFREPDLFFENVLEA